MFVNFFINRPIFSAVVSLTIVIAGFFCMFTLPVAQFPEIAPPMVQVTATYTGASPEVVEKTVTSPIEEQINGVEGMTYMFSTSSSDGSSTINVTFDVGYDLKIAAVDVQNKVAIATPQVPDEVRRYGISTEKKSTNLVLTVNLQSTNKDFDDLFLSNYAAINIVDVLKRIPGVGDVMILGERKYSMRFWLDPNKLASMNLTTTDIVNAIQDQNLQVAAGTIGQSPSPKDQIFQFSITTKGRLEAVKEFEDIVLRTGSDGAIVRMKDISRVELGAENYNWYTKLNGKATTTVAIYQLPGANSVNVADAVREQMDILVKRFPAGVKYSIPFDTTLFVKESIKEVVITLFMAVFLVFLVIYIFLQDWRSTLIPAVTIPISLIGTFALMMAFGFSINTLTLFGLVLAIGTVVDDAIVVVENVSRLIEEEGLSPKEATKKGMAEVVGPVIATTLVLFAVFVPVAFIPGISGRLYRQFALTIACAVGISTINALSMSPALCALVLRKKSESSTHIFVLKWFFDKFNQFFEWSAHKYKLLVEKLIKRWAIVTCIFIFLIGMTGYMFKIVPTGFIPDEDQGYFFVLAQGAEGSSLNRTEKIAAEVGNIIEQISGVESVLTVGGYNIINAVLDPSASSTIVILKPWGDRTDKKESLEAIISRLRSETAYINEAIIAAFNPPPIMGLSNAGGFQFELQDLTGGDLENLAQVANKIITEAAKRPELTPLSTSFKVNYPQYYVDVEREKAKSLKVDIASIFTALQGYLGSFYVNDFNKYGRVYRVYVQAKMDDRSNKTDITKIYVKNNIGEMVPISAFAHVKEIRGPQAVTHYNIYRTAEINGGNTPEYSSGEAIKVMEGLAAQILPEGYSYEWTGVAYQQIKSAGMAPLIFSLALVFVFLFLAAQYESWSMPLIIMFAVPLAILGALVAIYIRGISNDVYVQIGLVMLVGLASKNSILLVEFAKQKHEEGMGIVESAIIAAKIRLRPILMTALSFILGVIPLVIAKGAGAASRHSIGTAVFGGMLIATFLTLLVVPVLYVIMVSMKEKHIFGYLGNKIKVVFQKPKT